MITLLGVKSHNLSLGAAIVIVAAIAAVSYLDWHTYDDLELSADRSSALIDTAKDTLSTLRDAETGQRDFLLTGNPQYLRDYTASLSGIEDRFQLLARRAAETGESAGAALTIRLSREIVAEMASTIEIRYREGLDSAMALLQANLGQGTMDRLRAEVANLIAHQNEQLARKSAKARIQYRRVRFTVLGGALILVVLLCVSAVQRGRLIRWLENARAMEHAQKAALKTTLASIGDAVIATDTKGNVTFINPAAEQVTGWTAERGVGRPVAEVFRIVSEETHRPSPSSAERVLRDNHVIGLPNHSLLVRADGSEVAIDDSGAPIHDASGNVTGVVLVFRDITARRQAELNLEDSERRYRLLFESNPQPMWVYDQETLAFLAVNQSAVHSYGYSVEDFLAMTLKDIRPPEDIAKLLVSTATPPTGLNIEGPWRHRRKDGSIILVEIREHPILFDRRKASLVLAADITIRKQLEEQLERSATAGKRGTAGRRNRPRFQQSADRHQRLRGNDDEPSGSQRPDPRRAGRNSRRWRAGRRAYPTIARLQPPAGGTAHRDEPERGGERHPQDVAEA